MSKPSRPHAIEGHSVELMTAVADWGKQIDLLDSVRSVDESPNNSKKTFSVCVHPKCPSLFKCYLTVLTGTVRIYSSWPLLHVKQNHASRFSLKPLKPRASAGLLSLLQTSDHWLRTFSEAVAGYYVCYLHNASVRCENGNGVDWKAAMTHSILRQE